MSDSDAPKIIVDDDWKSQAQAEKERLAEVDRQAQEKAAEGGDQAGADFNGLLGTLVTQAMLYLGAFPGPDGRAIVSLDYAKLHIDLIEVLQEKTKGNLTDQESEDLERVLKELRVQFVEISKHVATLPKEAFQQPGGEGPIGGVPGAGGPTPGA